MKIYEINAKLKELDIKITADIIELYNIQIEDEKIDHYPSDNLSRASYLNHASQSLHEAREYISKAIDHE